MSPRPQHGLYRSSVGRRHPVVARRIALATTGALIAGAGMFVGATSAAAAVPTFPDNLAVFPDRDFVSIEGYSEYVGQTATLEVSRPGVGVVGSAKAKVSGGDVAFEVNHPGGVCWGADTGLKVTPDILPGDVVSISFAGRRVGETTVGDGYVTDVAVVEGRQLTIRGHIGANIDKNNTEQRIIQPEFKDTPINRRDIRAVPGPLTPAAKGGYSSSLEFTGDTFLATYVFDDPAMAQLAADPGLAPRLMSWEVVDLAGNRQGLTIAEFGESGGPGMGGCPNGPLTSGPAGPTNVRAVAIGTGNAPATVSTVTGARLTWTPAVAVAGTPPILGYRVTAVGDTPTPNGERTALQIRVPNPSATGTTVTGLNPAETYAFEVESLSRVGVTMPAVQPDLEIDTAPPVITASPAGGSFNAPQSVTLKSNEPGSDIYYTIGGGNPIEADVLAANAIHYTGPFTVGVDSLVTYAGFDPAGNESDILEAQFYINNTPAPSAPTVASVVPGVASAAVTWTAGDASVTVYTLRTYDAAGLVVGSPLEVAAPTATATVSGLTAEAAYSFTVTATNAHGTSAESAKSPPAIVQGSTTASAGPDQTVARAVNAATVTLTGAGSTSTGTTVWTQLDPLSTTLAPIGTAHPDRVLISNDQTLSPSFTVPAYRTGSANKLLFRLTVTANGITKTDDVLVTLRNDQVQFATARFKLGDFRITGGGSVAGATVTIRKGSLTGQILGTAVLAPPVPPAVGATFDLRIRTTAAPFNTNPGPIWLESNLGGVAGPFTVSN